MFRITLSQTEVLNFLLTNVTVVGNHANIPGVSLFTITANQTLNSHPVLYFTSIFLHHMNNIFNLLSLAAPYPANTPIAPGTPPWLTYTTTNATDLLVNYSDFSRTYGPAVTVGPGAVIPLLLPNGPV